MESQKKCGSLPLRTRISVAIISVVIDTSCRRDGTINRAIVDFFRYVSPANQNPVNGVSTLDVLVDPARKLWYRVFIPTAFESTSIPVIVFFHGGGFAFLSADSKPYDAVCRRFASKIGAVVVSVNYRLTPTPEHRYPSQYDDGIDVLRFLDEKNQSNSNGLPKNADLSRCFLAGDSAGGNLAHHMAFRSSQTNFQRLKVTGLVAIQPFFGGEERTDSELRLSLVLNIKRTDFFWKAFLPEKEAKAAGRDHEVINVSGPRAVDLSAVDRFPPVLVVIGERDPLQDWQQRYYDWLRKNGKEVELLEYPNMIHAFYVFPELHESGQLIDQIKDFINRRTVANRH